MTRIFWENLDKPQMDGNAMPPQKLAHYSSTIKCLKIGETPGKRRQARSIFSVVFQLHKNHNNRHFEM